MACCLGSKRKHAVLAHPRVVIQMLQGVDTARRKSHPNHAADQMLSLEPACIIPCFVTSTSTSSCRWRLPPR